jgi:drug/metabolite transporter (DMT)-like permease
LDHARAAHLKGFLLTLFGVLVLTPDTLLLRLIEADAWTIVTWRGGLMALALYGVFFLVRGKKALAEIKGLGGRGFAVSLLYALNAISFVLAVENTSVANVLVILAASPLFAALLSLFFLKETVSPATWTAILAGVTGVLIVVADSLGAGRLFGDFCALVTAVSLAAIFTIIRGSGGLNMIPATALGALLSALIALPFSGALLAEGASLVYLVINGALIMPLSFGLITLGPRHVPAPEVALLMLLETVLGPLWVWMGVGETPTRATFLGGAVVLSAVALHAAWRLLRRRPAPPPTL